MNPDQPTVPPQNAGDDFAAQPQPTPEATPNTPATPSVVTPSMPEQSPAPAPQVFTPSTAPAQFGANDSGKKHGGLVLRVVVPVVVVVAAAAVYFWAIPSSKNSAYLSKVKPAYATQADKMKAVYDTFNTPTFTSNNSSSATDAQTFAEANVDLKLANSATSSLQSDNHLSTLPGTTWFGANKKTQKQYEAMKQYVSDSQTFLTNYQQLVTYASSLQQIGDKQSQAILDSLDTVSNSSDVSSLLAGCQQAAGLLKTMTSDISALKPPADLQDFQTTLVKNLNDVNTALQGVINGLNSGDLTQVQTSASQLDQAGTTLSNFNPDISGKLQNNSQIHSELVKLKAENPLS